jgi:hypothetical protein
MTIQSTIETYINGNITTAKAQAKRSSVAKIRQVLISDYGYSFKKATLTAEHLKGADNWQEACDAE